MALLVYELPEKVQKFGDPVWMIFYNKLSCFVSELPEEDVLNMVVQCR